MKLTNIIEQITAEFAKVSPLSSSQQSLLKQQLQSLMARLDWVSRDEFDAQATVLARTRTRLQHLEKQVSELEKQVSEQN